MTRWPARASDALVLLGNSNVSYATGASWPLSDSGLAHVDRPVAVVLADDPEPHLFTPFREGAVPGAELADDHLHDPMYLEYDEGVGALRRRSWLSWCRPAP